MQIAGGPADLTRKRILAAAELVFSRDGFQGATTREIARQAGVNEVTLFRHFRTREELLRATLDQGCATFEALVGQSDEVWKDRLLERLEHFVREMYSVVRQREALVRAFASEARILPASIRGALQEFMEQRKARLVARLKQAQEVGLVRKDVDLSAASDLIRDSIHSAILRHTAYNTDAEAVDAHLRGVTDIFYHGIKANQGRDY
ncbi:MAG: TetR/AcrR family transcriptional regulator [Chthoniobacterales bacterium]